MERLFALMLILLMAGMCALLGLGIMIDSNVPAFISYTFGPLIMMIAVVGLFVMTKKEFTK
jgi:hypothetical protein